MKKYILLLLVALMGSWLYGQDVQLRYALTTGVYDTVSVYAQSATASSVDMTAITTSVLSLNNAQVAGYQSTLSQQWGSFAELTQFTPSIRKSYQGVNYDNMWQFGIASINQTPLTLPANNAGEVLILQVWFTGVSGGTYYLEDQVESADMNEILISGQQEAAYTVVATGAVSLPLELLSFRAVAVENASLLTWQTRNEVNAAGFEVEKSIDASSYVPIAWVDATGSANATANYRLTDNETEPGGTYFYRLRQVDQDGNYTYSSVVEVSFNDQASLSELFPNPARHTARVTVKVIEGGNISWEVVDALGQSVRAGSLTARPGETRDIEIDVADLAAGNYTVRFVKQLDWEVTRKLIVQ